MHGVDSTVLGGFALMRNGNTAVSVPLTKPLFVLSIVCLPNINLDAKGQQARLAGAHAREQKEIPGPRRISS